MTAPAAASDRRAQDSADAPATRAAASRLRAGCVLAIVLCASLFVVAQYGRLGHPLLWQDEGETAMFGRRVLDFGYPKVHGAEGVVYGMSVPMVFAVDAGTDAYTGSLWGQYYFAALGVALSDVAEDLHARTALVRLPFALAGSTGLALLWLAYANAFGDVRRRCIMGGVYLIALASSVSLLLHLREARYYALVMALVGALVWLRARASGAARGAGIALGLFALFNVFYPAALAVAAWIVLERLWPLARRETRTPAALRAFALDCAPVVVAAIAVAPVVIWFRMIPLGELMSSRYRFGPGDYAANLLLALGHLARHDLLLAAAILRAAAWPCARTLGDGAAAAPLWRLVLIWVALGARNPIFFERYYVALGPLLLMAALLDFERVRRALEAGRLLRSRRIRILAAVATVCVGGSLVLKAESLEGRVAELATPVRGPLDVAIPWVAERAEGTATPIVATNYETESWMFYLGVPVVGRFHAEGPEAARAEAAVRPDFVVPRRGYPHTLERLRAYLEPGAFERHALEIADLPYNSIPELSPGRVLALTHPFRTVRPQHPGEALVVWERRDGESAP